MELRLRLACAENPLSFRSEMNEPRPIGFWYGSMQQELPRPQALVRRDWISDVERRSLISYLNAGMAHENREGGLSWGGFGGSCPS